MMESLESLEKALHLYNQPQWRYCAECLSYWSYLLYRAQSVDSHMNEVHMDHSALSAKKKTRKLGGSFERVINLLTPRKSKQSKEEIRKTKVTMIKCSRDF